MVQSIKYCLKQPLFWLYSVLLLCALCKQLYQESLLIDSLEYVKKAHFLLQNWFETNVPQERILEPLRRTIGYPLILKIFYYKHITVYFFQFLIALMIPSLLHRLTLLLHYYHRIWEISMVLLLTFPLQFYYSAFLMPEIWVQFFLLLWVLAFFEGHKIFMPIWLTLLILLKPVFIILLPVPFLLALNKSRILSIFDGIPIIVFLGISFFHQQQYGIFQYSSVGTTNAYDYNRKKYLIEKTGDQLAVEMLYEKESLELNKFDKQDFEEITHYLNVKTTAILTDPVYWLVHFKGLVVTYFDPGRYDAMVFLNWNKTSGFMGVNDGNQQNKMPLYQWLYMGVFALIALMKISLAAFAIFHWKRYYGIGYMAIIIFLLAFMAGPVGSARYLMPVYPILAFMGALGYLSILKQLSK